MFDIQRLYLKTVQENGYRLPDRYLSYMPQVEQIFSALRVLDEGTVPCNNDACFELGNIWSEASLDYEHLEELVDAYYGHHRPEKLARAWFLALMSKYGWTWGMEKYERAQSDFESTRFNEMLEQVTRPTK